MLGSGYIGQVVGLRFGEYLGRQIALGACHDDNDDDIERRPFRELVATSQLPRAVDLRPWMTPVEEQGSIGSCTANAVAAALEYLIFRERRVHVDLSRLFLYFNQRLWDDRVREDTGASLVSAIRVLTRLGICRELSWPYQPDLFAVQPAEAVYREATQHRALDWWSVPVNGDAMRGCLAAGFPIAFGTRVTESFVKTSRSGECGLPSGADDKKHGRHALLCVGYDDARRVFIVKNSWGDDWGDRGYVYMPYDYVLNPDWTQTGWAIRLTTRDAFDPREPPAVNVVTAPRAPPGGGGSAGGVAMVANMGAQVAVGAITGSRLLGGLAGGLIAGLTPGIARVVRGRDRGAYVDRDRSDEILSQLRAGGAPPPSARRMPWDDGLDEEAAGMRVAGRAQPPHVRPATSARDEAGAGPNTIAGDATNLGPIAAVIAPIAVAAVPVGVAVAPGVGGFAPPPAVVPWRPTGVPVEEPTPTPPATHADFVTRMPNAIAEVWRENGGRTGSLGAPMSESMRMQDGGWAGSVVRFEKGAVFAWDPPRDSPRAKPFAITEEERALGRWVELGAGRSPLGWPIAPVQLASLGRLLWCTRGLLFDRGAADVYALFGSLFTHWQALGGLTSDLGSPISDQEVPEDPSTPQSIQFERGRLFWSAARGAWRE